MPMINVRYVTPTPSEGLQAKVAATAARLAAEKLGKDPSVTAVLAEPADPGAWFIAGRRPALDGLSAFWLDIKITAGTNTKAETAAFIAAAFTAFGGLLGPLHDESYVLIHAADGDAYGYGGQTQNHRWAQSRPISPG